MMNNISYTSKYSEYILGQDKKVDFTKTDPDNWTSEVRDTMSKSPASQLDIAYIRSSLHDLKDNNQVILSTLEFLKEANEKNQEMFYVEVQKNNDRKKIEKIHIQELLPKLVKETRAIRWTSRFGRLIKENKPLTAVIGLLSASFLIFFREKIIIFLIDLLKALEKAL